jgi:hypothetical protein
VVDTFRAIETSDSERRLQLVEADRVNPADARLARMAPARIGSTTHRRVFAAELLQVQQRAIIDSIDDCSLPAAKGAVIARSRRRRSNLDGSASCPRLLRCARNDSKDGISGGVSRNLDGLVT